MESLTEKMLARQTTVGFAAEPVEGDRVWFGARPLHQMLGVDPGFTSPASLPLFGHQQNSALKMLGYVRGQSRSNA